MKMISSPRGTDEVLEETDAGILSSHHPTVDEITIIPHENSSRTMTTRALTTTAAEAGCTSGYVECYNGFLASDSATPCATACGSSCCIGSNACTYFTGKVCKDGSCDGDSSCYGLKSEFVVNSCKVGDSCFKVAYGGGSVGIIVNSCSGSGACQNLGYYGKVGYVKDSCNGYEACRYVAYSSGETGNFKNSCNYKYACKNLGYNGKVGDVKDSCNKYKSCFAIAAGEGGLIGNVLSSCNNEYACYEAGLDGESVITSSLWNCCNSIADECKNANEESLPAECKVSAGYACCDTHTLLHATAASLCYYSNRFHSLHSFMFAHLLHPSNLQKLPPPPPTQSPILAPKSGKTTKAKKTSSPTKAPSAKATKVQKQKSMENENLFD
jgi:hypothetical protein